MLTIVPMLVACAAAYGRFVKRMSKGYQDALAGASDVASEVIGNLRTVRSFGKEPFETARYAERVGSAYGMGARKAYAYGMFSGGMGFLAYGAVTVVLWYGGSLVIKGEIGVGTLTAFLLYTIYVAMALGGLSSLFSTLMNAVGASERVFELLDRRAAIPLV